LPSIAEALSSAFAKAEAGTLSDIPERNLEPETPDTPETPPGESQTAAPEDTSGEERPGRTAGRPRDEKGRLLPGKPEKPQGEPTAKPNVAAPPDKTAPSPAPAAAATPPKPAHAKPSTWKKELDAHWASLPAEVQAEIARREGDYAKGVSTYKAEFDRLKGWDEAIQPFMPVLQQHGLDPIQHAASLMQAHQALALGTPEQKLGMFARLAQQYGVPLQGLFVQGQDGQIYMNQQLLQQAQQPMPQRQPQQHQQQPDVRQAAREALIEERALLELRTFESEAPQKYPHYEQVKATMQGLLQAGLADDMPSAYEAALRHPRHTDLYSAIQQQEREAEDRRVAEEKAKQAAAARANAFSPRSSAPTGVSTAKPKAGSVEASVRAAFDEHTESRV
jgi:hypothetical protein